VSSGSQPGEPPVTVLPTRYRSRRQAVRRSGRGLLTDWQPSTCAYGPSRVEARASPLRAPGRRACASLHSGLFFRASGSYLAVLHETLQEAGEVCRAVLPLQLRGEDGSADRQQRACPALRLPLWHACPALQRQRRRRGHCLPPRRCSCAPPPGSLD